jgi:hypothetical protein
MIGKNLRRDIETRCPEIMSLVEKLNKNPSLELTTELEIDEVKSCTAKLLDDEILNVCVHEVGHNLGFRHNFKGSVDKDNFTVLENGLTANSSSIMEYSAQEDDLLTIPGKYDIALIRFGYAGKVEVEGKNIIDSTELLELNRNESILDNLQIKSDEAASKGYSWTPKLKKYLYCTDEDVGLAHDAQCARHDSGTSPIEMVKFHIESANRIYNFRFHRFNRYGVGSQFGLSNWIMGSHFIPIKQIYDEWRFYLARYAGIGKGYLDLYNKEEFEKLLKDMSQDQRNAGEGKSFAEVYAEYRPAAELAYNYFKSLVGLDNRYCVVEDKSGTKEIMELERVRFEVFRQENRSIKSCQDAEIYLDTTYGVKLLEESGFSLNDKKSSLDFRDFREPNDTVGTMLLRMFAIPTLMQRTPLGIRHLEEELLPNFFDEPAWREELQNMFVDRIVKGVSLSSTKGLEGQMRFHYERPLIQLSVDLLRPALIVPGKTNTSNKRMVPFVAYPTRQQDQIRGALQAGGEVLSLPSGVVLVAPSAKNTIAIKMMKAFKDYQKLSSEPMDGSMFDEFIAFVDSLPTKPVAAPVVITPPQGGPILGGGPQGIPAGGTAGGPQQPQSPPPTGVTVQKFAELVQKMNELTGAIPGFNNAIGGKTAETIELVNGLFQAIAQLIQSGQVNPQQIMSQDISVLLPAGAEFPLFKENFVDLDKDIDAAIDASQANYDKYLRDINDYEAQANIILNALGAR